ncbi:MAG: GntR family transcriptional regulator [Gaiellales bacterium]
MGDQDRTPEGVTALRPTRRGTMAATVTAALRDLIVIGEIPPGAPLRLEEIAHQLGMSISPVREAVRQLEGLGLAEHIPYKGARVTVIDRDEMRDVYEARLALESVAVRRAAVAFDQERETSLARALEELSAAYASGERMRVIRANTAFHIALAAASGSKWLPRLLRPILETSERFSALVIGDAAEAVYAVEEKGHAAILEACRQRDSEDAEQAMRQHLEVFGQLFERDLPTADGGETTIDHF